MPSRSTRLAVLAVAAALVGTAAVAVEPAKKEAKLATATFAGGCFWSMEIPFDKLSGVVSTTSGFIGGTKANPTYEEVSEGGTGHAEAVQVAYDPSKVSYAQLLEAFWHNVDPLTPNAQFCDRGAEYRTAIFFHDAEQQRLAEESKRQLEASGRFNRPIVTQIVSASAFYPAEEYHQDYYQKNPAHYRAYRVGCGRDARLAEIWGKDAPKK
ncbi:peptide-methionine (S)-S-oxide reductase MsrA [Hyalangium rubrum]|uniref:Peptide methionine sulfoxide reductase MsrA n=1 Tax=Hyalangium rubrum TaxID=3103134 RepID=A0ABU5H768_9BACT|nr:peptide-methionine (S)-S-oxide reductase MsrA [Hyalangium sp. s54d21]MDY7227935.1 peptide-methionine (S)-S-oxide reductase MsrA [Hyalangium sp. s54d21]